MCCKTHAKMVEYRLEYFLGSDIYDKYRATKALVRAFKAVPE